MLPPDCSALMPWSTPSACSAGWACCSAVMTTTVITAKMMVIAPSTAHPCRISPTMRPKAKHRPAGIRKIASICAKFDSGVGFS